MYRPDREISESESKESSASGAEYLVAVLDDKLHGGVFVVHIRHLALETVISHDRRCKDHGQVLGRHLHDGLAVRP